MFESSRCVYSPTARADLEASVYAALLFLFIVSPVLDLAHTPMGKMLCYIRPASSVLRYQIVNCVTFILCEGAVIETLVQLLCVSLSALLRSSSLHQFGNSIPTTRGVLG